MKLGARIRKIRMFRNITQKELGRRLGYGESSADVRIAQYESGQRTPKQETLVRIAEILEVDVRNFLSPGIAYEVKRNCFAESYLLEYYWSNRVQGW